jgi:hypothetical protein
VTTARDRFKALLANALERVCVLEEQLELALARIAELEKAVPAQAEQAVENSEDAGDNRDPM